VADYHTATGGLLGGPNMGPIHLATALGGQGLRGITSAVAFATILAVVSGLVMATASAASHDLCAKLWRRPMAETEELAVFRGAAAVMGIVAVLLAIAFQRENVALFTAIAFSVAASANVPVLLLTFYWPRLTAAGALAGGLTGLAGSVLLIILGPLVWVKLLGHAQPVFPSEFPALVSLPLAMIAAIVVSLAAPEGRLQPVPVMPEGN
jgi:cation/acetate symporter